MSCTRADGTTTWQRQEGLQGRFSPLHEQLVGFLDTERASAREWSATDLQLAAPYVYGEDELSQVRDARRDLFARWAALPAGDSLELHFTPVQRSA